MPGHYEKALKKKLPAAQAKATNRTPTTMHKTPHQRSEAKKRGKQDLAKAHGGVSQQRDMKGKGTSGLKRLKKKKLFKFGKKY